VEQAISNRNIQGDRLFQIRGMIGNPLNFEAKVSSIEWLYSGKKVENPVFQRRIRVGEL
jgi:hypothetical protein